MTILIWDGYELAFVFLSLLLRGRNGGKFVGVADRGRSGRVCRWGGRESGAGTGTKDGVSDGVGVYGGNAAWIRGVAAFVLKSEWSRRWKYGGRRNETTA